MGQRKSVFAGDLNIYTKYVAAGSSSNQIYQDCLMAGSSSQNATETAYPTNQNRSAGTNYWITGSTIIPASALNTGSFFVTSSTGLGPVNTSAKVSITSSYFTPLFNSNINIRFFYLF